MRHYKKGFTLAEVLITLAVLGVVAALAIPSLLTTTNNKEYSTKAKKFYSEFNLAIQKATMEAGCVGDAVCAEVLGQNDGATEGKILEQLNVAKDLGSGSSLSYTMNTHKNGAGSDVNFANARKVDLADGMRVFIEPNNTLNCQTNYSNSGSGPMGKYCGYVIVDVNGAKSPNRYGKDILWFHLVNYNGIYLYPYGGLDDKYAGTNRYYKDTSQCDEDSHYGQWCTGRLMEDGWEMKY